MASETLKIDLKASDSTGAAFASLQRNMASVSGAMSNLQKGLSLAGVGAAVGLVSGQILQTVKAVMDLSDAATNMTNKLKAAGLTSLETATAQQQVADVARRSRSDLEETSNLYARIAFASEALGVTQREVSRVTETLSKAFKMSGKTALEAQSAVTQFTQALASGVLQGDELRSLRENAPEVARAIAKEFGVTVGALKQMGADGQLTADRVFAAVINGSEAIDRRFAQSTGTWSDYITQFSNSILLTFQSVQKGFQYVFGTSPEAIDGINEYTDAVDRLANSGKNLAQIKADNIEKDKQANLAAQVEAYAKVTEGISNQKQALRELIELNKNKIGIAEGAGIEPEQFTKLQELFKRGLSQTGIEAVKTAEEIAKIGANSEGFEVFFGNAFKALQAMAGLQIQAKSLSDALAGPGLGASVRRMSTDLRMFDNATAEAAFGAFYLKDQMKLVSGVTKQYEYNLVDAVEAQKILDGQTKLLSGSNKALDATNAAANSTQVETIARIKEKTLEVFKLNAVQLKTKEIMDDAAARGEFINKGAAERIAKEFIARDKAKKSAEAYGNELEKTGNKVEKFLIGQQQQIDQLDLERQAMSMSTEQYKMHSEQIKYQAQLSKLLVGKSPEIVAAFTAEADALEKKKIAAMAANDEFKRSFEYGMIKGMENVRDTTLNVASAVDSAFTNAFSGLEDALVSFVTTGKADFKSLANSIISDLIRIQIRSMLAGMFGGGGFNPLSFLFPGMGANAAGGGMPPSGRAIGGPVSANRPYIVGEKGPELFMSGSSGSIVPNNALGGNSGGGVIINQTINVSTGVQQTVRAEIQQLLPQISNAAKNAILDTKRRGGQFANAFGG